jgi:hypothetical protein
VRSVCQIKCCWLGCSLPIEATSAQLAKDIFQ